MFINVTAYRHEFLHIFALADIVSDKALGRIRMTAADQDKQAGEHRVDRCFKERDTLLILFHYLVHNRADLLIRIGKPFRRDQQGRLYDRQDRVDLTQVQRRIDLSLDDIPLSLRRIEMMQDPGAQDYDITFPESNRDIAVLQFLRIPYGHYDLNRGMPVGRVILILHVVIDTKIGVLAVIDRFMCAVQILNHNILTSPARTSVRGAR